MQLPAYGSMPETNKQQSAQFTTVLSLDGGGAKGVYSLGVLAEIEALVGSPLANHVGLFYGTSTGAIIAALLATGGSVEEICRYYFDLVPSVMSQKGRKSRSARLRQLAEEIFGNTEFFQVQKPLGIVTTNELNQTVMIFKSHAEQAHGRKDSFVPGFGCTIVDALLGSCAAFPFFDKHQVETANYGIISLIDGGFSVNNPTLLAIADCTMGFGVAPEDIRVISVGVGRYPSPKRNLLMHLIQRTWQKRLFDTTLASSTNTIEQIRRIVYPGVDVVRIDEVFAEARHATDFLERDPQRLNHLFALGRQSFGSMEPEIRRLFLPAE